MPANTSNSSAQGCFYFLVTAVATYFLLSFAMDKPSMFEDRDKLKWDLSDIEDRIFNLLVTQDKAKEYQHKYAYFRRKDIDIKKINARADSLFATITPGEPIAKKWSNQTDWKPVGKNKTVEAWRYESRIKMDSLTTEKRAFVAERMRTPVESKEIAVLYELRKKKLDKMDEIEAEIEKYNRSGKNIMQIIAGVIGTILLFISLSFFFKAAFS